MDAGNAANSELKAIFQRKLGEILRLLISAVAYINLNNMPNVMLPKKRFTEVDRLPGNKNILKITICLVSLFDLFWWTVYPYNESDRRT